MFVKTRNKAILVMCAILLTLLLIVAFYPSKEAKADTITLDTVGVENFYQLNSSKTFSNEVQVEYDGKTYTAKNGVLVSPKGVMYKLDGNASLLNEYGKYSLKYFFKVNNKLITAIDEFTVSSSRFSLSSNNGSSVVVVTESSSVPAQNNDDNVLFSKQDGLILRLNDGCVFNYNQPINLSAGSGVKEVIRLDPRLTYSNYDETTQKYNFDRLIANDLIIRLTDCYDSLNYIEILVDVGREAATGSLYIRACSSAKASDYIGMRYPTSDEITRLDEKEFYMDNERGVAFVNDFGTYFIINNFYPNDEGLALYYDNNRERLYYRSGNTEKIICDFKNDYLFGDDTFDGFKTGEVYLSVSAADYALTEEARIDIMAIDGKSISEHSLNDNYIDVVNPIITVLTEKTTDNGVYAAIGEKVQIPEVKVDDVHFGGNLTVNVYRNYGQSNETMISIVDNCFVVDKADKYSIVYVAEDDFGNIAEEVFDVIGVDAQSSLSLDVEMIGEVYFGESNILPDHNIFTLNNKDKTYVNIEAVSKKDTIRIDAVDREFVPMALGEYSIEYTYGDNVFEKTFKYTINVIAKSNVVFLDVPNLSRYYMKNAEYKFDKLTALVKDSKGEYIEKEADCYISYDNITFNKISDINNCRIEGDDTLYVKFTYDGVDSAVATAKIVDVGYDVNNSQLSIGKYFQGDFETETVITGDIIYHSNIIVGNNALEFINPYNYKNSIFEYKIPKGKDNFKKVNIKIINVYDAENYFVISIRNDKGKSFVSIDGGQEYNLKNAFCSDISTTITIDTDKYAVLVDEVWFDFTNSISSNLAYLEVELEGITGEAAINIGRVNNVIFNAYNKADYYSPELWIDKSYGRYDLNAEIVISSPIYSDILSPINYSSRKLSVIMPSGNYAKTIDGVVLDGSQEYFEQYKIKLTEHGNYNVKYEAFDKSGNYISGQYSFSVEDKVAPTITLTGGYSETKSLVVKAGDVVEVKYSITDNVDSIEKLYTQINVLDKKLHTMKRNVGNKFKFNEKGRYTIYVYCMDSNGNSAFRYFDVVVK